jgi:hypothetical protein
VKKSAKTFQIIAQSGASLDKDFYPTEFEVLKAKNGPKSRAYLGEFWATSVLQKKMRPTPKEFRPKWRNFARSGRTDSNE